MAKKPQKKLGQKKLTEAERLLIAQHIDDPIIKLIFKKILPSRVQQLALTCVDAAQNEQDLFMFKGQVREAQWIKKYLIEESKKADGTDFSNSDDIIDAEDDNSVDD